MRVVLFTAVAQAVAALLLRQVGAGPFDLITVAAMVLLAVPGAIALAPFHDEATR